MLIPSNELGSKFMLDEYCNTLSDAAQLKIALRFAALSLPVWNNYFSGQPDAIEKVNALIESGSKVQGGTKRIEINFPARIVERIEKNYEQTVKEGLPVAALKNNPQLRSMFATCMQPLTNPDWDNILPHTVRLVFTSIWNMLTWIVFKRKSDTGETHIYISINQSIDALVSEKILTFAQADAILQEYKDETKSGDEDAIWQAVSVDTSTGKNALTDDEIYRKIIGENIVKDPPPMYVVKEILRQMREDGKSFRDEWEEYYHGICCTYSYNKKEKSFWKTEADVIVASFYNEYPMSEEEMIKYISGISLRELRENGFEV
jgi:hypothetical protein